MSIQYISPHPSWPGTPPMQEGERVSNMTQPLCPSSPNLPDGIVFPLIEVSYFQINKKWGKYTPRIQAVFVELFASYILFCLQSEYMEGESVFRKTWKPGT